MCAAHQPLSVDPCTLQSMLKHIDEASGGVLRERDSQVTEFHSSHTPPLTCGLAGNGLSGSLFVCSGEGDGGCLTECSVVHEHQGDSLGREETGDGD